MKRRNSLFRVICRTAAVASLLLCSFNNPAYAQNLAAPTKELLVPVPLDSHWSFSNGQEFPGATVGHTFAQNGPEPGAPALEFTGDFTGGGAYCCAGRTLGDLQYDSVTAINVTAKTSTVSSLSVRLVDATGQTHQAKGIPVTSDGAWHTLTLKLTDFYGGEHWGGANDGHWHGPLTEFYLLLGPGSGPTKTPAISLADVSLVTQPAPMPAVVRAVVIPPAPGRRPITEVQALRDTDFLDSIGANSAIDTRGEKLADTISHARYVGIRWFRAGIEGGMPAQTFVTAYKQAGIRFDWCIGSGGSDVDKLLSTARQLQTRAPGALLSFEGPNEPNNWGITYQGQSGGRSDSWLAVAKLQSDLCRRVKSDPLLRAIPVWGISENGAETDNVGLQFLTIPRGAGCLIPDGTQYADFANVHNYIYHPRSPNIEDNKTWNAADPTSACRVDGLYGEYGVTWGHHYSGYSEAQLRTLPRVTTETGTTIGGDVTETIHALNLLSMYLDQFKRGWSYTAVYLLRDRVDEAGNQQFGFYRPNGTPRRAAVFMHNLTTILADSSPAAKPAYLGYAVLNESPTVHDMLLERSSGGLDLLVWDEKVSGADTVTLHLNRTLKSVKIYDPTVGDEPVSELHNARSLALTLTDHPCIVEIPAGR